MKNFIFIILMFFTCWMQKVHAQTKKDTLQIGLISDIQYADKQNGKSRFYKNSLNKLDEA